MFGSRRVAVAARRRGLRFLDAPISGGVPGAPAVHDYAPGFTPDLMAKDLGLAVTAARGLRLPVLVARAAHQVLRLASAHGFGRKDYSSVDAFLKPSSDRAPT